MEQLEAQFKKAGGEGPMTQPFPPAIFLSLQSARNRFGLAVPACLFTTVESQHSTFPNVTFRMQT
jgi:hypothetical protein